MTTKRGKNGVLGTEVIVGLKVLYLLRSLHQTPEIRAKTNWNGTYKVLI